MSEAGNTCVAEMVSCAGAGAATIAPSASTAALNVVFIRIYLPVGTACYLAFGRNQSPGEAPIAIARAERAVGLLERADFDVAEAEPAEQPGQVHARERLHERLVVAPAVAEVDQAVEGIVVRQEVEVHHPAARLEHARR